MSGLLLSPYVTFLLGLAAVLRVINNFPSPLNRKKSQHEGKTDHQQDAKFERASKKDRVELLGILQNKLVVLAFSFIIDPLLVATALTRNIGYQPFAWVMVAVVALTCYLWIRYIQIWIKVNKKEPVEMVEKQHAVPYKWVLLADKINLSHQVRYWMLQIINYLPDLYCWYLLLVVLGIFH
jgi:hypothetical protein